MKHFSHLSFAAAIFLFLQSAALSQISITTADIPNYFGVGNSLFIYGSSDTVTMNIGTVSSSISQTWTAPTVTIDDSFRTDNVLPSSTPYSAEFPGAEYAKKFNFSDTNITAVIYEYYKLSNDSIENIGSAEAESGMSGGKTIDTVVYSKTTKLYFHLPTQLGNVATLSIDTVDEGLGLSEITSDVTTFDAYGTLVLPRGSFGALRSTDVTSTKAYYGSTLLYGSSEITITWITQEGYELSVVVDTITSGTVKVHSVSLTYPGKTPTSVRTSPDRPSSFSLEQNYPNPFNPTTTISYELPANSFVSLKVYDILGNEVATLTNEKEDAGSYSVKFDGSKLASGVYFYRLTAGNFVNVKKLVLLK